MRYSNAHLFPRFGYCLLELTKPNAPRYIGIFLNLCYFVNCLLFSLVDVRYERNLLLHGFEVINRSALKTVSFHI